MQRNSGSPHPYFYQGVQNFFYNEEAISHLIAKIPLLIIQMFT